MTIFCDSLFSHAHFINVLLFYKLDSQCHEKCFTCIRMVFAIDTFKNYFAFFEKYHEFFFLLEKIEIICYTAKISNEDAHLACNTVSSCVRRY